MAGDESAHARGTHAWRCRELHDGCGQLLALLCGLQSAPARGHPTHLALQYLSCCHAGDETARARGTQKSVLERRAPPTFPLVIEMRERVFWVTHWVEDSVDCLLTGKVPIVQVGPGLGSGSEGQIGAQSCTATAKVGHAAALCWQGLDAGPLARDWHIHAAMATAAQSWRLSCLLRHDSASCRLFLLYAVLWLATATSWAVLGPDTAPSRFCCVLCLDHLSVEAWPAAMLGPAAAIFEHCCAISEHCCAGAQTRPRPEGQGGHRGVPLQCGGR